MGQTTTFQTAGAEFFQGLDAFLLSNWNQFSLTDVLLHSPIFRKLCQWLFRYRRYRCCRKKMKSRWLWNVTTRRPWNCGSWGNNAAIILANWRPSLVLKLFRITSGTWAVIAPLRCNKWQKCCRFRRKVKSSSNEKYNILYSMNHSIFHSCSSNNLTFNIIWQLFFYTLNTTFFICDIERSRVYLLLSHTQTHTCIFCIVVTQEAHKPSHKPILNFPKIFLTHHHGRHCASTIQPAWPLLLHTRRWRCCSFDSRAREHGHNRSYTVIQKNFPPTGPLLFLQYFWLLLTNFPFLQSEMISAYT